MVQLKAFRFLDPESDENKLQQHQQVSDNFNTSISVSSSTSSTATTRSFKGGILTSENSSNRDEATTLSSSEEYQLAQHEMIEEEDEEQSIKSAASNKLANADKSVKLDRSQSRTSWRQKAISLERQQLAAAAKKSPQLSQVASPRLAHRSASPAIRRLIGEQSRPGSPMSLAEQQSQIVQPTNHFEIRWYNINLVARKSKLPKLISENPVYRYLNKAALQEQHQKMFYSPPIRHKMLNNDSQQQISSISSDNLEKSDGSTSEYRPVLTNISGSVHSGQLTAILGPSGVGKTSLLSSLTGRNQLEGTGCVRLNGGASKRMAVVTVPQVDVLPGKLTALEDLQFTSRLKNPQRGFDHERNIARIVRHLHMDKFLNTRIERLSGGESRRLSIGRELLSSPDIVILDEPTSGLDANTCKKIIIALRDIVEHSDHILDRPMSIIVTIHQPQREVFNLFHRVYVMAVGGRAIYEGPPSNLMPTLLEHSSLGRQRTTEQLNENPAIVAIEVASGEFGPNLIEQLAIHHESQTCDELDQLGTNNNSPYSTPRSARPGRRSPLSGGVSPRLELLQLARLNQQQATASDSPNLNYRTPMIARRSRPAQPDVVSNVTSLSYASTYDADLPEPFSRLKVDKRLRRSVVMKSHFVSHTWTLMRRCWLLATRDLFLMAIRILGFVLIAHGMVMIFGEAISADDNQCPVFESEVDDIVSYMNEARSRLLNLHSSIRQASNQHLFFFHLGLCMTTVSSALAGLSFPLQMRMFIREHKNGWYSPGSFVTSQTLAELPIDMLGPLISVLIVYPLCNQPASEYHWRQLGYTIVLILAVVICKSQAQIVSSFFINSVENSVFLSCVAVVFPALLSGINVRIRQLIKPLQWLSYGSFLRYTFESLFVLRYGYGICPCDQELVNGYPVRTTSDAIPPQLDRLAQGFLDLSGSTSAQDFFNSNTTNANNQTALEVPSNGQTGNLFLQFLRLVTEAGNQFVPNPEQLGTCSSYRSLYLMSMDIADYILPKWISMLVFMFIVSRFLTYFIVRAVIKNH